MSRIRGLWSCRNGARPRAPWRNPSSRGRDLSAAVQDESTTPDLEHGMFQIGGCGLSEAGPAVDTSEKPRVTGQHLLSAAVQDESTTPDLEHGMSRIGGCGLCGDDSKQASGELRERPFKRLSLVAPNRRLVQPCVKQRRFRYQMMPFAATGEPTQLPVSMPWTMRNPYNAYAASDSETMAYAAPCATSLRRRAQFSSPRAVELGLEYPRSHGEASLLRAGAHRQLPRRHPVDAAGNVASRASSIIFATARLRYSVLLATSASAATIG